MGFDLFAPFALPYMQRPLLLLIIFAIASATVGVLVNLRKLEFLSDGLSHAVFPGLVIGFVLGGTAWLVPGALIAALIAALALAWVARRGTSDDTAIAIVLTSFFSLGVVVVSTSSDYAGQLQEIFFGRLLAVTDQQFIEAIALVGLAVVLVLLTWRTQLFRAFDEPGARAAGLGTFSADIVQNVAVALFVVSAASAVGTLLVLALLIVPAAAARALTRSVAGSVIAAFCFAAITGWLGLVTAYWASLSLNLNVAPGATVAVVMVVVYLLVLGVTSLTALRGHRAEVRAA